MKKTELRDEGLKPGEVKETVCHALVWDEQNRLLLLLRAGTGRMDGFYAPPGGHVQVQESLTNAVTREVLEEVGLQVRRFGSSCSLQYSGGVNHIYSILDYSGEPKNCEPEKCSEIGWFRLSELPENTVPWLSTALLDMQKSSC